jgi:phosphatidylserine decarboxylase
MTRLIPAEIDSRVKAPHWIDRLLLQEDLNFLLTNRVPRHALTHLMGWFSRIESPLLTRAAIAVWRVFTELDLSEAQATSFRSLHACFTRALKPGSRPIDPDPKLLTSPCDAIVGACGSLEGLQALQAKGMSYPIDQLFGSAAAAQPWRDGTYVTLRLTSSMYHRFHAPCAGRIDHLTYISGDTWNVNPIALKRIERLYCRNERAVLRMQTEQGHALAIVPVAAILVASIRLHALDVRLHLKYRGPNEIPCIIRTDKGQELGWFEHGSTIIVFAPQGFTLAHGIASGTRIRMGQALMAMPEQGHAIS